MSKISDRKAILRVIKRQEAIVRKDIQDWKTARQLAENPDEPRQYRLQNLYRDVMLDALMTSQVNVLRIGKSQGADFDLVDQNGDTNEKATSILKDSGLFERLVEFIVGAQFYGYSLLEFSKDAKGEVDFVDLPRENVVPETGLFYPDYYGIGEIRYRELPEFGKTIVEICPNTRDFGLINKAVPYVLMKKFALSCWSELCEIFGMPPRVLKTNTNDNEMLNRAEQMMRDIGSAAYFIIDTTEEIDFAQGTNTNGDVYKNLIRECDEQISLINLAAVIGQDTENGNYSKEKSSADLLESVVQADKRLIESTFNRKILPALSYLGLVPEGLRLRISKSKNLQELWTMATQAMPYFEVDPKWIKETFGIEVTGARSAVADNGQLRMDNGQLSADSFFA